MLSSLEKLFETHRLHVIGPDVDMPLSEFLSHATQCAYFTGYNDGFAEGKSGTRKEGRQAVKKKLEATDQSPVYIILKPKD